MSLCFFYILSKVLLTMPEEKRIFKGLIKQYTIKKPSPAVEKAFLYIKLVLPLILDKPHSCSEIIIAYLHDV